MHQENITLSIFFLDYRTLKRRRDTKGKDTHRNLSKILGTVKLTGGGEMARMHV